jgi:hypothetical protein
MDLTHALWVFRLYCNRLKQDPSDADSMLLTDKEREVIQDLKDLVKEYADLIAGDRSAMVTKAV